MRFFTKISLEGKKPLISSLIKELEIFSCNKLELTLKSILFNFSVYKGGMDVCEFLRDNNATASV